MMYACSLWNNNIGDGGAVALGKALEVNSSLQTLEYVVGELVLYSPSFTLLTGWLRTHCTAVELPRWPMVLLVPAVV